MGKVIIVTMGLLCFVAAGAHSQGFEEQLNRGSQEASAETAQEHATLAASAQPDYYLQFRNEKLKPKESTARIKNLAFILCHDQNYDSSDQAKCSDSAEGFNKDNPLPADELELQRYEGGLILHLGLSAGSGISNGNLSQYDFYTIALLSSFGFDLPEIPKSCLEEVDYLNFDHRRNLDYDGLNACMIQKIKQFRDKAAAIH